MNTSFLVCMKKALVIFNPVSGKKKWRDVPTLMQDVLEKYGYDYTWYETKPSQNLKPLFESKYDRIVVSGGDGTVAEVIKTMVQCGIKTPLVVVPQGSGNVLALTLGIPLLQPGRALELGINGEPQKLDLMCINKKYYGAIAVGRGYDAFLMRETPRELKRKLGLLAYAWVFLKTAFSYGSREFSLTIDGKTQTVLARSILVFNLFPLPFVPIRPHDGVLDIVVLSSKGLMEYFTGKKISIKSKKELEFQLDGEVLKSKAVNVEVLPSALSIVYKK